MKPSQRSTKASAPRRFPLRFFDAIHVVFGSINPYGKIRAAGAIQVR
jgi:hypothetical protein